MKRRRRYHRGVLLVAVVLLLAGTAAGCGAPQKEESAGDQKQEKRQPLNWKVPEYEFTDQDGKPFGSKDLKGQPYLVDMVFTRCPDVCPPMTANMVQLQKKMKVEGAEVDIVSFSVDPHHDTPKVLKRFAKNHHADLTRWHLLTGYREKEIKKLAYKGFKSEVQKRKPQSKGDPLTINHPVSFFLVDGEGKVYERYNGLDPEEEKIIEDIKRLKGQE
ncbi:SCO family protein [Salinithrix halophila]|uniref:SCO family protein n=1 Tax=Salinithrix halophila TaxID=1485204 RepID=A0ABV8JIH6_9BACL